VWNRALGSELISGLRPMALPDPRSPISGESRTCRSVPIPSAIAHLGGGMRPRLGRALGWPEYQPPASSASSNAPLYDELFAVTFHDRHNSFFLGILGCDLQAWCVPGRRDGDSGDLVWLWKEIVSLKIILDRPSPQSWWSVLSASTLESRTGCGGMIPSPIPHFHVHGTMDSSSRSSQVPVIRKRGGTPRLWGDRAAFWWKASASCCRCTAVQFAFPFPYPEATSSAANFTPKRPDVWMRWRRAMYPCLLGGRVSA